MENDRDARSGELATDQAQETEKVPVKSVKKTVKRTARKRTMTARRRGGASVPCPTCAGPTRVLRTTREGSEVVRERCCRKKHRFVTTEKMNAHDKT